MDEKLKKLFEAARKEPSPVPSNTFAARVVSAVSGREKRIEMPLMEQMAIVARRLLVPAMAAVLLLAGGDWIISGGDWGGSSDWTRLTDQWIWTFYS